MAEPYYTSVAQIRTDLGLGSTPTDDVVTDWISDAEDEVDAMLGARVVDSATGRKVVESSVRDWQFDCIARATRKIVAAHYANPALQTERRYRRQRGPDFEVEDPRGSVYGTAVTNLIDRSELAVLTTRASGGGVDVCATTRPIVHSNAESDPW